MRKKGADGMQKISGKWIIPREFAGLAPIDVFHREGGKPSGEHPDGLKNLHIHFLANLTLKKHPKSAILRVSADDCYKLRINGRRVCQGPAPSYYFRYNWNEVDITDCLDVGENRFDFEVYYQGLINRVWCSGDLRCGMICDVIIDGKTVLSSGEGFRYYISKRWKSERVFGYDTQFAEEYDASVTEPTPLPVCVKDDTDYVFAEEPAEHLQVYDIEPKRVEILPNGGIFCDFGQELTGTLEVVCEGESGEVVDIYCGEETDGSPERVMHQTRCGCDYHDIFTLGDEKIFRGYDYKAFRYAAVLPRGGTRVVGMTAVVRHAEFNERMRLVTDNNVLRAVFDICKRGVMLGTQEVFVDCPSREKGQYSGDLLVTGESYFWLTGNTAILKRAIINIMDTVRIDKGLMAVAPCSHMQEIADYSLQFPLLARRFYDFSGDKAFLQGCLGVCEEVIEYFAQYARADGLLENVPKWNLVDWPENLRDGYEMASVHNVINAWYICAVRETERIRDILGIAQKERSDALVTAFNRAFYRPEIWLYVDNPKSAHSALHSNVMPLFVGIASEENVPRVADYIEKKGLVCGVYFAYFLLRALTSAGRHEPAYRLITSTGENSWYNMVREGGTACFEAWGKDKKWNTSLCHPWASAPIPLIAEICGLTVESGTVKCGINRAPTGTDIII